MLQAAGAMEMWRQADLEGDGFSPFGDQQADENGNDALGIRTVGYLALSFDHRLIDGADADRFMSSVKKTLEKGEFDLG